MMILTKAVMLRARAWGTTMHARIMEKELRCDTNKHDTAWIVSFEPLIENSTVSHVC